MRFVDDACPISARIFKSGGDDGCTLYIKMDNIFFNWFFASIIRIRMVCSLVDDKSPSPDSYLPVALLEQAL